jgi:hypothetical protein
MTCKSLGRPSVTRRECQNRYNQRKKGKEAPVDYRAMKKAIKDSGIR